MTQEHPITPPPELIAKWTSEFYGTAIAPEKGSSPLPPKPPAGALTRSWRRAVNGQGIATAMTPP
jgi:hypothetical protein